MVLRSAIKKKEALKWAEKQYKKHRRHNGIYAEPGVHDCIIVLDNLKPSFNIGKIFRSGDAFGVHEIHLIGTDYFPTSSAKGSFKWVPAYFHRNFEDCYAVLKRRDYTLYILEPTAEKRLNQIGLDDRSAFVFGHEEHGISFTPGLYPDIKSVQIPQFGRVDSLNVSVAASVVMYEFLRQHPK